MKVNKPHRNYIKNLGKKCIDLTVEERREYDRLYRIHKLEMQDPNYAAAIEAERIAHKQAYIYEYNNRPKSAEQKKRSKEYLNRYYGSLSDEMKDKNRKRSNEYCQGYRRRANVTLWVKFRAWLHNNAKRGGGTKESWVKNAGCTRDEFKAHIESQFVEGMTWSNWSVDGWHIDHITPLSKGGTNHYTNLQPLWAKDNLSKSDKLI
jgi:5-methylcytosine-specific restriction endonuclease McrA